MHKLPGDEKPVYVSLKHYTEMFDVGMNHAVEMLAEKRANPGGRGRAAAKALKELGEHPDEGGAIQVMDGRYGPYVKWGKVNATLPDGVTPEDITVEKAVELIGEKAAKSGKKKAAPKKAAAKKTTAKKTAAKKTPAKKATAKKTSEDGEG